MKIELKLDLDHLDFGSIASLKKGHMTTFTHKYLFAVLSPGCIIGWLSYSAHKGILIVLALTEILNKTEHRQHSIFLRVMLNGAQTLLNL